jgi:rod shape determining protein RodA
MFFENVFKQHHRDRFNIGKTVDLKGIDTTLNQSEIAIDLAGG